jgi:hypothetical protein
MMYLLLQVPLLTLIPTFLFPPINNKILVKEILRNMSSHLPFLCSSKNRNLQLDVIIGILFYSICTMTLISHNGVYMKVHSEQKRGEHPGSQRKAPHQILVDLFTGKLWN